MPTEKKPLREVETEVQKMTNFLSNKSLLLWVAKFGASLRNQVPLRDITPTKDSLVLMDESNIKGMVTNCKFSGEVHSKYSLKQIVELARIMGDEAELLISPEENSPCIVRKKREGRSQDCLVIIAPKVGEENDEAEEETPEETEEELVTEEEILA